MNEEMFTEIQEMVLGLIEKHSIDKASKEAAQQLQKKFGNGWNVIIGKAYGSAVTAVKDRFELHAIYTSSRFMQN